jgi:RNA polymerase sigma-70 factor (ECF subfamily)
MSVISTPNSAVAARAEPSAAALRDADLVAQLQAGDLHAAFDGIMQRYESKVFHLCVAMLRDTHAAEEAAQESFLRVWCALPRYAPQTAALSTWIYAIGRNRCLTELVNRNASGLGSDDEAAWAQAEQLAAAAPNDESALALLRQLIDALPHAYRSCLRLYYFEELSVTEVSAMLGLPEGTVKTHLHRARRALRQLLEQRGLAHAGLWL